MKHYKNEIARLFLLILFIGYWSSVTLFPHAHFFKTITIVHSHPFSKNAENKPINHHHTPNELLLISVLSNFISTLITVVFSVEILFTAIALIYKIKDAHIKNITDYSLCLLRAPPQIIS